MRFCLALLGALLLAPALATDRDGRSAQLSPKQQDWVKGLKNQQGGLCCDGSDGWDVDWRMGKNGYEVFYQGSWRQVHPLAVIDQPNMIGGRSRAWFQHDGTVRCFLRGIEG